MKKLAMTLMCALILISMFSCSLFRESDEHRLERLIGTYRGTGEAHNEALDILYRHYAEQQTLSADGCQEYCRQVAEMLNGMFLPASGKILKTGDGNIIPRDVLSRGKLAKNASNAEIIEVLADSLEIIQRNRSFYDSLSAILDASADISDKQAEMERLYLYVDDHVSAEEDRESLMHGLSTSIYSAAYWEENGEEWQALFGQGMHKASMGIIGAIAIIDGVGAAFGALEGFRDTEPGEDGRAMEIIGRAVGEAAKTSTTAMLGIILL